MSKIVGMNGRVLSSAPPVPEGEVTPDVTVDFFLPYEQRNNPRCGVLPNILQGLLQLSLESGCDDIIIRFKRPQIAGGLSKPSMQVAVNLLHTNDPKIVAFRELAMTALQEIVNAEKVEEGEFSETNAEVAASEGETNEPS